MNNRTVMVEIKDLSKKFGSKKLFNKINLEIYKGELLAVIGFSGCGKSTLLKIISGLVEADSGNVKLKSEKIGLAFQYSALFDSLTVKENIIFPLVVSEEKKPFISDEKLESLVKEKLSWVGLNGIENQYPSELSGGMKKRVSFARAIVDNPELILYDEPTAGLDPVASTLIEDLIITLREKTCAAGVVVTHQASTIKRASDRVIMLYEGGIAWTGTPDELFDNKNNNPFAKQFRDGNINGPMLVNT